MTNLLKNVSVLGFMAAACAVCGAVEDGSAFRYKELSSSVRPVLSRNPLRQAGINSLYTAVDAPARAVPDDGREYEKVIEE